MRHLTIERARALTKALSTVFAYTKRLDPGFPIEYNHGHEMASIIMDMIRVANDFSAAASRCKTASDAHRSCISLTDGAQVYANELIRRHDATPNDHRA